MKDNEMINHIKIFFFNNMKINNFNNLQNKNKR